MLKNMCSGLSLGALTIAATLMCTSAWAASTATKITSMSSKSSTGVHKVPNNAPFDGNLDPRAETYFTNKVNSNSNESWSFKANIYVTSARRTSVAQWLQHDPSTSGADARKPVVFLTVTKKSNGKLFICNGNSTSPTSCNGVSWNNIPAGFLLEMSGNGKTASVKINGSSRNVSMTVTPAGVSRTNGTLEMRWGAYHHNTDSDGAKSTAQVRVYNITSSGF